MPEAGLKPAMAGVAAARRAPAVAKVLTKEGAIVGMYKGKGGQVYKQSQSVQGEKEKD